LDVVAAACIFLAAGLLMMPAIQNSRFQSRLIVCQNNLRELGRALTDYSDRHGDYFPKIPSQGPMAAAGVYAPVLLQEGFLGNARRVVCPDSPLARQDEFTVPSLEQLRAATPGELAVMRQEMGGSYGYHLGHVQDGKYQATRNLRRGTFALMADAPNRSLTGRQSTHHAGRGQNVLFEDGHVQFVTCSKPIAAGDDIFSNDNGLIAAGLHRDDAVIGSSADPPIFYVGGL